MIQYLTDIWENLISVWRTMGIIDYIDILLLAYLIYKGIKIVKETRAVQLVKGIVVIVVLFFVVNQLQLKAMGVIMETFINVGIVAILIVFQPELRRILERVGRTKVKGIALGFDNRNDSTNTDVVNCIEAVCSACEQLSQTATGALIVFERETKLGEQIDTGTILNAVPSTEMIGNIFFPNTPLHDGAMIIRDSKIYAAGCFLPKPQKEELISKALGSRHRAAIGMSEVSDSVVIIVSEETGTISIAENGSLTRFYTKDTLRKLLTERLIPEKPEGKKRDKKKKKIKKNAPAENNDKGATE
ncbi:MAG: TIGR00159 family protein [Ruminococcaceae bacterium]|nr:TIGR00159 family protein [Oscillospiraceae bacterium]